MSPVFTQRPGSTLSVPVFVSHWDRRPLQQPILRWRAHFVDRFGTRRDLTGADLPLTVRQYGVTDVSPIGLTLPNEPGLVTLVLWFGVGWAGRSIAFF
jgi:hypothetical protein